MKSSTFDTAYNRYIKNARAHVKGTTGLKRAELVAEYFKEHTAHPHVDFTYKMMMTNRTSDNAFAVELMQSLANLCAENEVYNAA